MMLEGSQLLIETLNHLDDKLDNAKPQDLDLVTIAPKLTKELGQIDWNKNAIDIHNLVRGLQPWPSGYTEYKGKQLKILSTEIVEFEGSVNPGQIVAIDKESFIVSTAKQALRIKEVHLQASKRMGVASFLLGHPLQIGFSFS